jgi:hypothetical protein
MSLADSSRSIQAMVATSWGATRSDPDTNMRAKQPLGNAPASHDEKKLPSPWVASGAPRKHGRATQKDTHSDEAATRCHHMVSRKERNHERPSPVSRRALRGHSINEDHRGAVTIWLVGSSSTSRLGWPSSAAASATRLRCPPLSCGARAGRARGGPQMLGRCARATYQAEPAGLATASSSSHPPNSPSSPPCLPPLVTADRISPLPTIPPPLAQDLSLLSIIGNIPPAPPHRVHVGCQVAEPQLLEHPLGLRIQLPRVVRVLHEGSSNSDGNSASNNDDARYNVARRTASGRCSGATACALADRPCPPLKPLRVASARPTA